MIGELKKICNSENEQYQSFQDELFSQISKDTLMKETLYFNNDNLKENDCRIILMKLIYFINQGYIIDKEEKELLFFRITKLLNFQNPFLRRMTYKILKLIINQEYEFIITSSLKKDITSSNKYIQLFAINLVPYLSDISNMMEFTKYIQQAIVNKSKLLQIAALLSGLHIYLKYSNVVSSWLKEIKEALDNKNVHALILFYQIQKQDKNLFLKALLQMIKNKHEPDFMMNILRFIKNILFAHKYMPDLKFYEEELVDYLFLQISSRDALIFFETVKIFMAMIKSISVDVSMTIINILCRQLKPEVDNITQYSSLIILKEVSKVTTLKKLVNKKIFQQLEHLIYSPHAGISANSLFVFLKIQNQFNQNSIRKIYFKTNNLEEQNNFLQGLIEFQDVFHIIGGEILRFIGKLITNDSSDDLIKQAFKVIKYILRDINQQLYYKSIHTLFSIAAECDYKYKFKVVRLVHKEYGFIQDNKINKSKVNNQFVYLQDFFSKIQNKRMKDNSKYKPCNLIPHEIRLNLEEQQNDGEWDSLRNKRLSERIHLEQNRIMENKLENLQLKMLQ
ncbi:hypothetical protein pb186bvf_000727 [Paramecium bursaria]